MTPHPPKPTATPWVLLPLLLVGCDRTPPAATTRPAHPLVASTVPAATDLIVGLAAADQLVAVSTYDAGRPDVGSLPKAGDYQTVDWERLAALHPSVLFTAISRENEPAGFRDHAAELHIRPVNVQVNRLEDLAPAIRIVGDALDQPDRAATANRQIAARLARIHDRVAGLPPVPTLLVLGPDRQTLAGPGTYLDDLLQKAGGTNVAAGLGQPWPRVDRELLASLHPAVIIELSPDGKPAATAVPLPPGRYCLIADRYALQPGWHLPDEAEQFAQCLHPTPPTSHPSPGR